MKHFYVNIVTPQGMIYDKAATFLRVNTEAGVLGILPNHAPLISALKIDAAYVKLFEDETVQEDWLAVNGGIIEIRDNVVTVISNSAETMAGIDTERARQAKERAEELLKQAKLNHDSNIDISRAKVALTRAINRLTVANKK